ncbi:PepSY domain-containing protein [Hymenobacter sp. BT664]|uniref:PepSY domain-containing protein n=1 Tax=Hymenobacter montanus TaxID=2771359 RepID=A0A927BFW8_9BACT|nr:PepSY-associated TM helix domain-containing protein [Hymenobacter montanus]MBD2770135.1 PepSY domain-containing protein [Hymenobacter montanus]
MLAYVGEQVVGNQAPIVSGNEGLGAVEEEDGAAPEAVVFGALSAGNPLFSDSSHNVTLNIRTGEVTQQTDLHKAEPSAQADALLSTLHFGQFGGLISKIGWSIGGLSPALLSLTGFALWWRRSRSLHPRRPATGRWAGAGAA